MIPAPNPPAPAYPRRRGSAGSPSLKPLVLGGVSGSLQRFRTWTKESALVRVLRVRISAPRIVLAGIAVPKKPAIRKATRTTRGPGDRGSAAARVSRSRPSDPTASASGHVGRNDLVGPNQPMLRREDEPSRSILFGKCSRLQEPRRPVEVPRRRGNRALLGHARDEEDVEAIGRHLARHAGTKRTIPPRWSTWPTRYPAATQACF